MAFMSPVNDADAVWTAIIPSKGKANGPERLLAMGSPVTNDLALQLTHRQTNMYLTCDSENKTITEFGVELECFADRSMACGKLGLMVSEFKGLSTSQTLTKPDAPIFSWHFVTGASSSDEVASLTKTLPPPATKEAVLNEIQNFIRSRGIDAFWALREHLYSAVKKLFRLGKLDREDLKSMLVDFGVTLRPRYLDILLDSMGDGNSKTGLVHVDTFLAYLRGPLPPQREALLTTVYRALQAQASSGVITVEVLRAYFRGEDHPLVTYGNYSEADALKHLLNYLDLVGSGRGKDKDLAAKGASLEKFVDYYADLSAAIDDDQYFTALVNSNWAAVLG
jgi:Ca2+-binding EF-hand superfamily protein